MPSDLFFSERVPRTHNSNRLSDLLGRLRSEGRAIVNLAESNPTRCGIRQDWVLDSMATPESLSYQPDPRGLLSAREALAERLACAPDSLFLTASTSEAYSWLFKLLADPGDTILVPKPGYPLFDYLAGLEGVRVAPYRLAYAHPSGWTIDRDSLEGAAASTGAKAVVVINPNNPTGSYLKKDERDFLRSLCAERGLALISDEVFLPYALEADASRASMAGSDACLTVTLDGLSKLLCLPQVKLGWMRLDGPAMLVEEAAARLDIIADTFLSASAPAMNALPDMLTRADAFVARLVGRLSGNLADLRSVFGSPQSPYRVLRCEGGWTALLECPRVESDEDMALALLRDEGLYVHPGYLYDFEREGVLTLSLLLEPEVFSTGVRALKRRLDRMIG
ncbi:MAG: pyridoxal phosphate-dependent aminotransferase [Spirochaetales bacterium]|nr:pyridoxal phosphate-dependent aminotransferase [Spirochaetales bacterium]